MNSFSEVVLKSILKAFKRYSFFIMSLAALFILFLYNMDLGIKSAVSFRDNVVQMLMVLPPIMLILGLVDIWVPSKVLMKYMGDDSGFTGVLIAILVGSLAAGPMYAAFPFTAVLMKKGVRFSNVIIFMNAWCVTKVSTLLFEFSALGYAFTIARFVIDLPGVIIMGYLVEKFVGKTEISRLYSTDEQSE